MSDYIKLIRTSSGDKQIDYTSLANLPTINNQTLTGNIELTASNIGADVDGAADDALASAKEYADTAANTVKNDLLNGAGDAYDTLKELGELIDENTTAIDALEVVATGKADKEHSHTIANVTNLQVELDKKQNTITGGATTITSNNLTSDRALISTSAGKVAVSNITSTELSYLDGVTSNVQTQLNKKTQRVNLTGFQSTPYTTSVIALCLTPTTTTEIVRSYSSGRLVFQRNNGLYPPRVAYVSMAGSYGVIDKVMAKIIVDEGIEICKPCIFTYNGVTYGGVEIKIDSSAPSLMTFDGATSFDIFGVDIYNSNTSTVLNQEIYDSISYDAVITQTGWKDGDYSFITSENIGSQSVNHATTSDSAVSSTKATQDSNGNIIVDTYATKTELDESIEGVNLNSLGVTATTTELNYVDGVTSNIQTQLNNKLSLSGGTLTGNITVDNFDTIKYNTANAQIVEADYESITSMPFASDLWHDRFAFLRNVQIDSNELMNQSGEWANATDTDTLKGLFAQHEKNAYMVIPTESKARRITISGSTLNLIYSGIRWFEFGVTYASTFSQFDILIEGFSNSSNSWKTLNTNTLHISDNSRPYFIKAVSNDVDWGGWQDNSKVRLTFTKTTNLGTGWVSMSCIKALTPRKGDQGGGAEDSYPFSWDKNRKVEFDVPPTFTKSNGTAPFNVTSKTKVTNLNSDLLDGNEGSYYLDYNNLNNTPDEAIANLQTAINTKADSSHTHTLESLDAMSATNPTGVGSLSINRATNSVVGSYSTTLGRDNIASADYSYAEGGQNTASDYYAHAEGNMNTASGYASHAEGIETTASGYYSHSEGGGTRAYGTYSHAEGKNTTTGSITDDGVVEGGDCAHAEGNSTIASGSSSHAEGDHTNATGHHSHSEGYATIASGLCSHAEGSETVASGIVAHAEGIHTTALDYQHAQGHYNDTTKATVGTSSGVGTGTAFVIGNGTEATKSNAFRINYMGQMYAKMSTVSTGADYAEYFEWQDLNPDNEDRRGYFVTLDGDKIKIAEPNDYILGIISGLPSIIGNGDEDWRGRYIFDEFGDFVYEDFEYEEKISEETTITKTGKRYKENPEYDPSLPYIHRGDRPEWDTVGMLGVLSVRDDGTCQVNGYCTVSEGGIATTSETGYRVIKRVNDNIVKVIFR